MDLFTAIGARYSTREFRADRPVARELLEQMIDAGRRAPTARNEQPWEFVVVTDAAMRCRIADLTNAGKFIATAPACIAVFCKDGRYYLEDGCAATQNILLAATALGVQSCWVAGDKKDYAPHVRDLLAVPPTHRLISLLALGYAATETQSPTRRDLAQVLHWERY